MATGALRQQGGNPSAVPSRAQGISCRSAVGCTGQSWGLSRCAGCPDVWTDGLDAWAASMRGLHQSLHACESLCARGSLCALGDRARSAPSDTL
eukprot:119605-Chlamydomonas_euryale.AAC.5